MAEHNNLWAQCVISGVFGGTNQTIKKKFSENPFWLLRKLHTIAMTHFGWRVITPLLGTRLKWNFSKVFQTIHRCSHFISFFFTWKAHQQLIAFTATYYWSCFKPSKVSCLKRSFFSWNKHNNINRQEIFKVVYNYCSLTLYLLCIGQNVSCYLSRFIKTHQLLELLISEWMAVSFFHLNLVILGL